MKKIFIKKTFVYSLIICFWILILGLFLFSSHIFSLFKRQKSITVFTYPLLIDAEYITRFEKQTGIKVYINYFESSDELLVKLKDSNTSDYDIIFPTDYTVEILAKKNLLRKIDKSKIDFWHKMNQKLTNLYYDPNNLYSIPYLWDVYGIGIDKKYYDGTRPIKKTWDLLFDEKVAPPRVGMINNPREALLLSAFYLFRKIDNFSKDEVDQMKKLLIKQKKWVDVYTDLRVDDLLTSGTCQATAGLGSDIWQEQRFNQDIDFFIPEEGSFFIVDSICLPKGSKKQDLAYQFINFLFQEESLEYHIENFFFFPTINTLNLGSAAKNMMNYMLNNMNKYYFFKNVLTDEQLHYLWIQLKGQ